MPPSWIWHFLIRRPTGPDTLASQQVSTHLSPLPKMYSFLYTPMSVILLSLSKPSLMGDRLILSPPTHLTYLATIMSNLTDRCVPSKIPRRSWGTHPGHRTLAASPFIWISPV